MNVTHWPIVPVFKLFYCVKMYENVLFVCMLDANFNLNLTYSPTTHKYKLHLTGISLTLLLLRFHHWL